MKKILSIDGGGIRGIIPALVLAEIEKRTDKPISACFDLFAGTSTGGILSLGLTKADTFGRPEYSAADLAEIYAGDHTPKEAILLLAPYGKAFLLWVA